MFRVGDKVSVQGNVDGCEFSGETGTVVCEVDDYYGIDFGKCHYRFHRLYGLLNDSTGYYVYPENMTLIKREKVMTGFGRFIKRIELNGI